MTLKRSFEDFLSKITRNARSSATEAPATRPAVGPSARQATRPATRPATHGPGPYRLATPAAAVALPRPATSATLREWITGEVRRGVPRWTVHRRLAKAAAQPVAASESTVLAFEMKAIEDLLVERNRRGKELERAGQIDQAIALYEANVVDRFNGSHAYERLRILYKGRGDFANTIRVCSAYLKHVGTDARLCQAYEAEIANIAPARTPPRQFQETRPA
ncbi:MAG TPA: hypothetical protein VMU33_20440 [Burkholderiaceae bacterium]|nr:hypothetical protein [Burkholderiaceae bacterium]